MFKVETSGVQFLEANRKTCTFCSTLVASNNSPLHSQTVLAFQFCGRDSKLKPPNSETERLKVESLIKTLPAILTAAGSSAEVAEAACFAAWKHAVGDALSAHAVPVKLEDQTLI